MFSPIKHLQRAYCLSKVPPPYANPNKARKVPWTPYDQIAHNKESDFIEDVMEFRTGTDEPSQRMKGGRNFYQKFVEKMNLIFGHSYTFKQKLRNYKLNEMVHDQRYNDERYRTLGPDLAAAHFFCARGCAVKFVGMAGFIQTGVNKAHTKLPPYRDDAYKVEAINAVFPHRMYSIVYEGLLILSGLESLRWISFKNNFLFDNWCMDRLSLVAPHLEFINLSGCSKIDHNAFSCIYRFKKLRCICVENTNQTDIFKLTCLTLEAEHPNLTFVGLVLRTPKKSVFNS